MAPEKPMKEKKRGRSCMEVGDRVLIQRPLAREVFIVARDEVPHAGKMAFVTKSGGDFTIGVKVWKSDYVWNDKSQMWTPKS